MELRYNFRIYPTLSQKELFAKSFGCAIKVYNDSLAYKKEEYTENKKSVTYNELSNRLTEIKKLDAFSYLNEVSSIILQQAIRNLIKGYKNFFNKHNKFPRFKSKKDPYKSIHYTKSGFKIENNKLYLAPYKGFGSIKVKWSRKLPSNPSSLAITYDGRDKYYVSFTISVNNLKLETLPKSCNAIGIDLGTTRFLTTSDGEVIDNPKFLKRLEKKLIKLQKSVSRKKKGSKNKYKEVLKLNKVHNKIKNCRLDSAHKLSSCMISENQAIYAEDIDIKQLLSAKLKFYKNKISKSIADAGWGMFLDMLEYKANLYNRIFKRVPAEYTSQICHNCKHHIGKLTLDIREWRCPKCDITHDRDINAAKNILTVGQTGIVCREYVRPDSLGGFDEAETSGNMQIITIP